MPEEFQQIKTELRTNAVPIVIGATAILLVAVGIYLFASRPKAPAKIQPTPQIAIETPIDLSQGQPTATSPLAGFVTPTPGPSPLPKATPTPKPGTITKTKGGQLPKSGFPALALIPISVALLGSGFILRRKI